MTNTTVLNKAADNIRILAASMVEKAKSGHPGGAMGGADFVNTLFAEFLVYDPSDPKWINRDRFFLDPGHMSPMLYSVLALTGKFTLDELKQFRQWGSPTPGHPEVDVMRGIENTSGPLGQGHAMAVGAAIAERFLVARFGDWMAHKTYAFISDGGIQEEISQGAGRIAGYLGLNNLIMFYDSNDIQLSTDTDAVTKEDTAAKYRAWGWNVLEINGNDADAIRGALIEAGQEQSRPTLIIGKTIMGKGVVTEEGQSYEGKCSTHGQPLSAAGASFAKTIAHLGGNPDEPFAIFPEVEKLYADRKAELLKVAADRKAKQAAWEKENPELAVKLHQFFSGKAPEIDYKAIAQKPGIATRAASANVLAVFAEQIENMIVSSADLANSDKTDGFLKKTHAFKSEDFTGAFLQAGVSELTMAAIMNGMMLHGGVIGACGTFFVFSDYMKPAARMAALMEVPVKYIWTHDAFRVGEDGPTREPVEQEAQIRLMEKLKNHNGQDSVRVFRPADAGETTVCWQMAVENMDTPTALIFSRQPVNSLPEGTDYEQARKGAYVVNGSDDDYDVILLASGSEVATLLAGAGLLRKDGIKLRIVSVPSEGLFRSQSKEYQESILPNGAKIFGLTAGLSVTLEGLVGSNGMVYGMNTFGYSAPYKVLDEKLGFTAENIYKQVKMFISNN